VQVRQQYGIQRLKWAIQHLSAKIRAAVN
jgi:hypothetical protein